MTRLNRTEPAIFSVLPFWANSIDAVFSVIFSSTQVNEVRFALILKDTLKKNSLYTNIYYIYHNKYGLIQINTCINLFNDEVIHYIFVRIFLLYMIR
jgi:hypothetical protein